VAENVQPSSEPDAATTGGTGHEPSGDGPPPPASSASAGTGGVGTQAEQKEGGGAPPPDSPLDVSGTGTSGEDTPPRSPSGT